MTEWKEHKLSEIAQLENNKARAMNPETPIKIIEPHIS